MIVQPLGFRSFRVNADQGFFLNEHYLDLHGVNRHQELLDHGWATSFDGSRQQGQPGKVVAATSSPSGS
jgi:beta-galactosidase